MSRIFKEFEEELKSNVDGVPEDTSTADSNVVIKVNDDDIVIVINNDGEEEDIPLEEASKICNVKKITKAFKEADGDDGDDTCEGPVEIEEVPEDEISDKVDQIEDKLDELEGTDCTVQEAKTELPEEFRGFVIDIMKIINDEYAKKVKLGFFTKIKSIDIDKIKKEKIRKTYYLNIKQQMTGTRQSDIERSVVTKMHLKKLDTYYSTATFCKVSSDKQFVYLFWVTPDVNAFDQPYVALSIRCSKINDTLRSILRNASIKCESTSLIHTLKEEFSFLEADEDVDTDTEIKMDDDDTVDDVDATDNSTNDATDEDEPVTINIDNDQKVVINVGGEDVPLEEASRPRNVRKIREAFGLK